MKDLGKGAILKVTGGLACSALLLCPVTGPVMTGLALLACGTSLTGEALMVKGAAEETKKFVEKVTKKDN